MIVERESGSEIMSVIFFQEGEFLSKEFKELCENNGIDRPLTIPRTQQNRVLK